MVAGDMTGVQAPAWFSPSHLTCPLRMLFSSVLREGPRSQAPSLPYIPFPCLWNSPLHLGCAPTPSQPPQPQSPSAPVYRPTQNLLGETRAPYADLVLSRLQSPSSVTLGAHHHNLVRHCFHSSNEDGDQVRDVINNNNG